MLQGCSQNQSKKQLKVKFCKAMWGKREKKGWEWDAKRNKLTSQPTKLPVFGCYPQNLFCISFPGLPSFSTHFGVSLSLSSFIVSSHFGPKFSSICNGQDWQQEHTSQAGGYVFPFLCFIFSVIICRLLN